MVTPSGQALQRVCPHCSTIAVTASRSCPFCRRSYHRRLLPWIAALALLQTVVMVVALAVLLTRVGNDLQDELDRQVSTVQRDLDRQVGGLDIRVRRELRRELDARLPASTP